VLQRTRSIQLTDSGCRVLRSSGLNHYKPSSVLVFIRNSPIRQALRPPPHLRIRAGAFRHPAGGFSHRHLARQEGKHSRQKNFEKTENHVCRWDPVFYLSVEIFIDFEFRSSKPIVMYLGYKEDVQNATI
jgi:hypothetical protein